MIDLFSPISSLHVYARIGQIFNWFRINGFWLALDTQNAWYALSVIDMNLKWFVQEENEFDSLKSDRD